MECCHELNDKSCDLLDQVRPRVGSSRVLCAVGLPFVTALAKPSEEDASGKKKWRRTNSGSSKVNFGIETVFEEVWQHLRHILAPIDGFVAPDDEEDEGVHEEREQSQRKEVFDQLHQ
eukprot:6488221-Amphidinium_carterae.1